MRKLFLITGSFQLRHPGLLAKAPRAATWELHNCASLIMSHAQAVPRQPTRNRCNSVGDDLCTSRIYMRSALEMSTVVRDRPIESCQLFAAMSMRHVALPAMHFPVRKSAVPTRDNGVFNNSIIRGQGILGVKAASLLLKCSKCIGLRS